MIAIDHLTKRFGRRTLWEDLCFEVPSGAMHALTGPSGCGKTTLLNCIGLLEEPTGGTVNIDGEAITGIPTRRQQRYRRDRLGYLFQNYALIENQTPEFNLRIGLGPGVLTAAKRRRIAEALERVGLKEHGREPVYRLSGGEQQRVALARLIVKPADVILADEPTGALDEENSTMVLDTLRGMAREGASVVIATHDRRIVAACDDHVRLGGER